MRLILDFETASTLDLRKTGVAVYAACPDTQITCLCFAVDDGPVETLTWQDLSPPASFVHAVHAGATIVAHNFGFEIEIYHRKLVPQGWPLIPLAQWSCTMARAMVAGYPAGLEAAGAAAGLKIVKDRSAHGLMLRFARPRSLNPLVWWHQSDPVRFQQLIAYCRRDVEAERELDRKVPELSPRERALFELDHAINQRGLYIDRALVASLGQLADKAHDNLTDRITDMTGGVVRSLNQVALLRSWLRTEEGLDIPDLRRATVQAQVTLLPQGAAKTALQARLDASRSSTAKLTAIAQATSADGRARGTFQYYGASRTGRWAGRRVQPQNLFRGSIKDVPAAVLLAQTGIDPDELEMFFADSALGIVASCLRSTITAAPGHVLAIADFSQIEARCLAWLAGQHDVLDVFRKGEDVYTYTANMIGSESRQLGKVVVLACGYGMGAEKFVETAHGYGLILDEMEARDIVGGWRENNKMIVDFWWTCHRKLMNVVRAGPGTRDTCGRVELIHRKGAILIKLPSGRHLVYRDPEIQKNGPGHDEFTYMGSFGGNWVRLRAWPGRTVENITQAVARDVMAEAMLRLGDLPLVATIHDELVAEPQTAAGDRVLDRMLDTMRQTPGWAPGLPMDAAGFLSERYVKG